MSAPREVDVSGFRILRAHWPGFPPVEHGGVGDNAPPLVRDLRFRRNVEKLHRLGSRVLHEYLIEVAAQRSILTILEDKIGDYAALDRRVLAELGADRLPPVLLHEVRHEGA